MINNRIIYELKTICLIALLFAAGITKAYGQFLDEFDDSDLNKWNTYTGDGEANISLKSLDDHATIQVDATDDQYNIWWAIINRTVNKGLNLAELQKKNHKLRLEVKVRASHAPRRVNLHMFRQNSSEHHKNLMEYDIPDTTNWHTLSLTAEDLEVQPGDTVLAQLSLIDWGTDKYEMDVDYFKVSVIDTEKAGPDKGLPLEYRPQVPEPESFDHQVPVSHDATVDLEFPESTLDTWKSINRHDTISVMSVNSGQRAIMRWNLDSYKGKQVKGWSVLELTPHSAWTSNSYIYEELGQVRISEIIGGNPEWEEDKVSWTSFSEGMPANKVINPQMILDTEVNPGHEDKLYITIPEPVMQRLIDNRSKGLAIQPLGPIQASFYDSENEIAEYTPTLYFNVE